MEVDLDFGAQEPVIQLVDYFSSLLGGTVSVAVDDDDDAADANRGAADGQDDDQGAHTQPSDSGGGACDVEDVAPRRAIVPSAAGHGGHGEVVRASASLAQIHPEQARINSALMRACRFNAMGTAMAWAKTSALEQKVSSQEVMLRQLEKTGRWLTAGLLCQALNVRKLSVALRSSNAKHERQYQALKREAATDRAQAATDRSRARSDIARYKARVALCFELFMVSALMVISRPIAGIAGVPASVLTQAIGMRRRRRAFVQSLLRWSLVASMYTALRNKLEALGLSALLCSKQTLRCVLQGLKDMGSGDGGGDGGSGSGSGAAGTESGGGSAAAVQMALVRILPFLADERGAGAGAAPEGEELTRPEAEAPPGA